MPQLDILVKSATTRSATLGLQTTLRAGYPSQSRANAKVRILADADNGTHHGIRAFYVENALTGSRLPSNALGPRLCCALSAQAA
jgi:hypothetical protein